MTLKKHRGPIEKGPRTRKNETERRSERRRKVHEAEMTRRTIDVADLPPSGAEERRELNRKLTIFNGDYRRVQTRKCLY